MSTAEAPGNEAGMAGKSGQRASVTRRQAITVVAALTVLLLIVVVNLAFSTNNPPHSIDGTTATSSHFIESS